MLRTGAGDDLVRSGGEVVAVSLDKLLMPEDVGRT